MATAVCAPSQFPTSIISGSNGVDLRFRFKNEGDAIMVGSQNRFEQYRDPKQYSQPAFMYLPIDVNGQGSLLRTVPYQGSSFHVTEWDGVLPNDKTGNAKSCSYVNARGFYQIKGLAIKVGVNSLFSTCGHKMITKATVDGTLDKMGEDVGYYLTQDSLVENSRKKSYTYVPWNTFPTNNGLERALAVGGLTFFNLDCSYDFRPVDELVIDHSISPKAGIKVIPRSLSTSKTLKRGDIRSWNYVKLHYADEQEVKDIETKYREVFYDDIQDAGTLIVQASSIKKAFEVPLNASGLVNCWYITIQSVGDLAAGNHLKLCDDDGNDYPEVMGIFTMNHAQEDAPPAEFLRKNNVLSTFGTVQSRFVYVIPQTESLEPGKEDGNYLNTTGMPEVKLKGIMNPHTDDLKVTVMASKVNCHWTKEGKIWKMQ